MPRQVSSDNSIIGSRNRYADYLSLRHAIAEANRVGDVVYARVGKRRGVGFFFYEVHPDGVSVPTSGKIPAKTMDDGATSN